MPVVTVESQFLDLSLMEGGIEHPELVRANVGNPIFAANNWLALYENSLREAAERKRKAQESLEHIFSGPEASRIIEAAINNSGRKIYISAVFVRERETSRGKRVVIGFTSNKSAIRHETAQGLARLIDQSPSDDSLLLVDSYLAWKADQEELPQKEPLRLRVAYPNKSVILTAEARNPGSDIQMSIKAEENGETGNPLYWLRRAKVGLFNATGSKGGEFLRHSYPLTNKPTELGEFHLDITGSQQGMGLDFLASFRFSDRETPLDLGSPSTKQVSGLLARLDPLPNLERTFAMRFKEEQYRRAGEALVATDQRLRSSKS